MQVQIVSTIVGSSCAAVGAAVSLLRPVFFTAKTLLGFDVDIWSSISIRDDAYRPQSKIVPRGGVKLIEGRLHVRSIIFRLMLDMVIERRDHRLLCKRWSSFALVSGYIVRLAIEQE